MTDAFLAEAQLQGADLRWAELQGAFLAEAQLQGAVLCRVQLQGASLLFAQLQGADLRGAELRGAHLGHAQLQGADLSRADLRGADLRGAQLQGADLSGAKLQGAGFTYARLQGVDLRGAELQGADLRAELQGASLAGAQLRGTDLRRTTIWRAEFSGALWDLADLRGSAAQPMTDSEIDTLMSEATIDIPDEGRRKKKAEWLNYALRSAQRPAKSNFPEEWRSEPNVMFDPTDFESEPLGWGPAKWATESAYDEDLAVFLGDLACGRDVVEAQTRGLADRALETGGAETSRVWPVLFAARVIGTNCPPAKGLHEDMRRQLEQLAVRGDATAAPAEAAGPDPVE